MPSLQYSVLWRLDMSEKKSPPRKQEKITVKTPQSDGKTLKRKLASPGSPTDDEADKRLEKTPKRKRGSQGLESSPLAGNGPANKTPGSLPRLGTHNVPLSERQQLAMIMRMTDETSQDSSPKHTSPSQSHIASVKRTPGEKKVHKRNERGETQLHIAAKKGDTKLTKRLIRAGADVNVKDFANWTALHEACNHGCLAVAKQLLKAGANVNVQGLDKDTPLHDAAMCGHSKLVELLLKHGANPLQPNSKGKTAVDVAFSPDIEKLLRKEIISSSSETSSNDELRSPTSPESTTSTKDEDRQVDIEEFALRVSSQVSSSCMTPTVMSRSDSMMSATCASGSMSSITTGLTDISSLSGDPYSSHLLPISGLSMMSMAKRAVPKSPEGKTNSPRLFLKFRPKDVDNVSSDSSDKSKDLKGRQYKSYSVTLETSELKGSPANSASSSNDSDLYNPQLDSGAKLKFADLAVHNRNNGDSKLISKFSLDRRQTIIMNADEVEKHIVHSVDSMDTGNLSLPGATPRPPLVSVETGPFSPHFEDISDPEEEGGRLSRRTAERRRANEEPRIPVTGVTECSNSFSRDTLSDSRSGLFPPLHRSSSCVAGSKDSSRVVSPYDGSERTRHNSAPSRKTIQVCESSQVKKLDIFVPEQHGPINPLVLGNLWESRPSSVSSIPKTEVHVSLSQPQHFSDLVQQSSPRPERETVSKPLLLFKSDRDVRDSKAPSRSQTPERDIVRSLFKSSEPKHMSPRVPPLKIIIPAKTSSTMGHVDRVGSPFTNQHALPYVVNPSHEAGEGEVGIGCVSQDTSQASSTASSRPSSRASSPTSDRGEKVDIDKIVDRLTSQAEEEEREAEGEQDTGVEVEALEQTLQEKTTEESEENKVEDKEKTTMVLRDRDKGKEAVEDKDQEQPAGEKEQEKEKEVKEEKEERRITRSLRSHTQMLLQQQQQQKAEKQDDTTETEPQPEDGITKAEDTDVHKKRKLRPKADSNASAPGPDITLLPPVQYEKPQNPYELYLSIRSQVASRRDRLMVVPPKPPNGFKDYKTVNCSYVLHGNSASTLAVPMLSPPNSVSGPMRDLFVEQEKARYKLRLQHIVEREKLMLSIEQEVLRVNGRSARAVINQSLPLGFCTILKDEEIYNIFDVEQVEEREKNVSRTRYNGRQFLSWLQDVYDKFEKIKEFLLLRHHHEAESLFAVQKMEWEWKMKELGMCDTNSTPVIDELHVPMIQVNDDFDLLPV